MSNGRGAGLAAHQVQPLWTLLVDEAAAAASLIFTRGEQLTVPLITSRSSKENNDSLFPCRNEL